MSILTPDYISRYMSPHFNLGGVGGPVGTHSIKRNAAEEIAT